MPSQTSTGLLDNQPLLEEQIEMLVTQCAVPVSFVFALNWEHKMRPVSSVYRPDILTHTSVCG
jgi:hypothetical protein